MATRYDNCTLWFYAPDDIDIALVDSAGGNSRRVVEVSANLELSGVGEATVKVVKEPTFGELEQEGNLVLISYSDFGWPPPYTRFIGGTWKISGVSVVNQSGGPDLVEIKCIAAINELAKIPVWDPIGKATTYSTTVAVKVEAPTSTTLREAAVLGATQLKLTSSNKFVNGDVVTVTLADTTTHSTICTEVQEDDNANNILIQSPLPSAANINANVTRQTRMVKPDSGSGWVANAMAQIALDNSTVLTTLVESGPDEEGFYTVRDGFGTSSSVEKPITITDWSEPATNDLAQIMTKATTLAGDYQWTIDTAGTLTGSKHVPEGATTLDLLLAAAEYSGENFRQADILSDNKPRRAIKWLAAHERSGYSTVLRLYNSKSDEIAVHAVTPDVGIITGDVRRTSNDAIATRIYPVAGDDAISLFNMSAAKEAEIESGGLYQVVNDRSALSPYELPYICVPSLEGANGYGVVAEVVTFSEVKADANNSRGVRYSADVLAQLAVEWLADRAAATYELQVSGVHINSRVTPLPGQYVNLYFNSGTTTYNNLSILIKTATFNMGQSTNGLPLWDFTLVESMRIDADAPARIASMFKDVKRMGIRNGSNQRQSVVTNVVTTGGAVGDHGALTGLGDDDHTQYLLASGTRKLTGNLAVDPGITIDGTDISAHVANANAHHAAVTVGSAGLTLVGQALDLGLRVSPSPGLSKTSGLGIDLDNTTPASGSGLTLNANGLKISLSANSGLTFSSNALLMGSPGALGYGTLSSVSGSTHYHQIVSSAWPGAAASLLNTDASGYLSVQGLSVGAQFGLSSAALSVKAAVNDDYSLLVAQKSGQTAAIARFENSSGSALLLVQSDGALESGLVGFVSGQTGWQVKANGDAEFNNLTARGEFHASVFVADEMHAAGGTLAVMTTGIVSGPVNAAYNVLPTPGSNFTLQVNASPNTGYNLFPVNSIIRCKYLTTEVGTSGVRDVYMKVAAVSTIAGRDMLNGEPGYFLLTCTRLYGGTTGERIQAGTAVIKWGVVGGSGYTGGLILTSDLSAYSTSQSPIPYIDIFTVASNVSESTWLSSPPAPKTRVRIGNLDGVLGLSEQWGIAMGTDLSDTSTTSKYAVFSDLLVNLRNIPLEMYSGANLALKLDATVPSIAVGTTLPTGVNSGGAGFWVGNDSGTYKLRIGQPSGTRLEWNGTTLNLYNSGGVAAITIDGSGSSYFSGVMTIGSLGEIRQGTGTAGSVGTWSATSSWGTYTGIRIGQSGGIGSLATYNAGVPQVYLDTTGTLQAGAGKVTLNSSGVKLIAFNDSTGGFSDMSSDIASIRWLRSGTSTVVGYVASKWYATNNSRYLQLSSGNNYILVSDSDIGGGASIYAPYIDLGRSAAPSTTTVTVYANITQVGTGAFSTLNLGNSSRAGIFTSYQINNETSVYAGTFVKGDTGLVAGAAFPPTVSEGQIASDLNGNDYRAIVLADSLDVSHPFTSLVAPYQYGGIGKVGNASGGVSLAGWSSGMTGIQLNAYATTVSSLSSTSADATIIINGQKTNGTTGSTTLAAGENLLVVKNAGNARFIIKGNGDLHTDGSSTVGTYDAWDDVGLVRAYSHGLSGVIKGEFDEFVRYNKQHLEEAGIVHGTMVNQTALSRLLAGAIWQLHQRLARLESKNG